jgi:hypothetical protein
MKCTILQLLYNHLLCTYISYTKCAVLYACLLTFLKNYSQTDREFFDPIEKSITPGRYKKVSENLMKNPAKN